MGNDESNEGRTVACLRLRRLRLPNEVPLVRTSGGEHTLGRTVGSHPRVERNHVMTSTPQQAWLYVRGDESIRVVKFPIALILRTFGPGHASQTYPFQQDAPLEDFRRAHEEQLLTDGWTLHVTYERRVEASSHSGVERRRSKRE